MHNHCVSHVLNWRNSSDNFDCVTQSHSFSFRHSFLVPLGYSQPKFVASNLYSVEWVLPQRNITKKKNWNGHELIELNWDFYACMIALMSGLHSFSLQLCRHSFSQLLNALLFEILISIVDDAIFMCVLFIAWNALKWQHLSILWLSLQREWFAHAHRWQQIE